MSKLDGITKSRSKSESYKGFAIIRVLAVHHWWNNFNKRYEMSRQYETKREVYYEFCKDGEETRPSQAYGVTKKTKDELKECIDNMISGKEIYFTEAEREKYVYKPNHKCKWAYGYKSLMQILKEHKKADKRMKILLEDRLDDANFHYEAGELADEHYEALEDYIARTYQFREKFEVYTSTMRKRIDNPEGLIDGLKKVLEDYLRKQGIKDTSVDVNFVKEW